MRKEVIVSVKRELTKKKGGPLQKTTRANGCVLD